jgi:hypothetical protein
MRDDTGVDAMAKQQHKVWVADSGMQMEPFSFAAVGAVDDDLYEVPSEMLCNKSMRRVCNSFPRMIVARTFRQV